MMRLAAHRGGALLWPENSLRAFRESIALGVDLVEMDVHLSADGEVVVIHDPTLDRTTDATGPVGARTAAELGRVRLRGPDGALTDERVPTLAEVLSLAAPSRVGLLVELKGPAAHVDAIYERAGDDVRISAGPEYPGLVERTIALVGEASMLTRVNVMAFNPDVVLRVRALEPALATTFLVSELHVMLAQARPEDAVAWAARLGATHAGLQYRLASRQVVDSARAAGVQLGVWTVNDELAMRQLCDLGVDVLTTDRPDLARRLSVGR
jgi:glycerophosphoryl diester phosphodiesterase